MTNYRQKPKKSLNLKPIAIASFSLLFLLLVWGVYLIGTSTGKNSVSQTPVNNTAVVEDTPIKHGASGKSLAQDQKDSLQAAKGIIIEAGNSPRPNDTIEQRLIDLDEDNSSGVTPALMKKMRFPTPATTGFKSQTYQSLITLNAVLGQQGKKEIKESSADSYQRVYVDSQLGIAYVPLSIFTGNSSNVFSFEMVYVDNEWKLSPYSLLQEIKLSAMATSANPTSKSSPTK